VLLNGLNFKMLGGNETTLGQLGALYALGALVGSILGLRLKATKGLGRLYLAYAMLAVLLVLIALVSHYTTAVVVYALIGLIATVQRILLRAILYPVIPSQVVGRFFAVMSTVSVVIAIGAVLAYGWLGDYHVRTSYALLALAPLAALILVLRLARLQKVS
jgi:MFS family permease